MASHVHQPLRIGLLGISLGGLDAKIFRGINRYARPNRRWRMITAEEYNETFAALLALQPAGIIGHIHFPATAHRLKQLRIPAVNLSGLYPDAGLPLVRPDDRAVGALGATHLLERGFRHLAYFAGNDYYQLEREAGFIAAAKKAGIVATTFRGQAGQFEGTGSASRDEQQRIEWLRALPKPVGVLAAHDRLALQLVDICHSLDLDVPGEVAIVGVDDEEIVCESSWPTISSVRLPGERLGHEAARILEAMMRGRAAPKRPVLLPPVSVTVRQSSDAVAVSDPVVARAMQFIRDHAGEGINVADLAGTVPVNRRTFERQFRAVVGRTPLQEIIRVRLEKAKQLLATTDLPMPAVAEAAGFRNGGHLWEVFQRQLRLSPRAYRARLRG